MTKIEKIEKENRLVNELKAILDKNANFVRPLSEFWKGCSIKECVLVNQYGLWLSSEGSSCIGGYNAIDYYQDFIHPIIKDFMKENGLMLEWYDCGTPVMIFND